MRVHKLTSLIPNFSAIRLQALFASLLLKEPLLSLSTISNTRLKKNKTNSLVSKYLKRFNAYSRGHILALIQFFLSCS